MFVRLSVMVISQKVVDEYSLNFVKNGLWEKKQLIRFWVDLDQEICFNFCHCDVALRNTQRN